MWFCAYFPLWGVEERSRNEGLRIFEANARPSFLLSWPWLSYLSPEAPVHEGASERASERRRRRPFFFPGIVLVLSAVLLYVSLCCW